MADSGVRPDVFRLYVAARFETGWLGGNCVPSNCGLSGMNCHT